MTETLRFDVYINGWTRLELKDGNRITYHSGGPTEEGYSYTVEVYERKGDELYYISHTSSRDCDGRLDRDYEAVANPSKDGFTEVADKSVKKAPLWTTIDQSQRDYAAEAMGY